MSGSSTTLDGPDLAQGIPLATLADGAPLLGHAHGEPVLLVRRGQQVFAVGATCTHYGGPLAQGLVVGDTIRCPWHHACFSLRTGAAVRAPALDGVACWRVEQRDAAAGAGAAPATMVYVREQRADSAPAPAAPAGAPASIIIIGGGAAGNAAAEMLRREGYSGPITLLSADAARPVDRPNLSKGYLAGTAPEEWTILRPAQFYQEHRIDLRLRTRVRAIDAARNEVVLEDGSRQGYGALLLATGATPTPLRVPGSELPHVRYLRTLADSRALIERVASARQAVVIGASFIGLEAAASLRARGVAVHVVAPEAVPMTKVLGPQVGGFIRALHEQHDVVFHLGTTVTAVQPDSVTLQSGEQLAADLVVVGIGVQPALALAEAAGLAVDRGVAVNEYLQSSVPNIFAAGDIARWPDRLTGERIRIEHFVVAERQGQTAARNLLGRREAFDAVPFFWTEQYDFSLAYIGHAEHWDQAEIDGSLQARDCTVTYRHAGRRLAVAVVGRDLAGLRAELEFERSAAAG
jgi:NADPH-dependent 2,4-dienoyl-CoA reductase/sulfur reductase-like enzyme/nitrite reductase/ring-hydroxylating ferredoxin subunit